MLPLPSPTIHSEKEFAQLPDSSFLTTDIPLVCVNLRHRQHEPNSDLVSDVSESHDTDTISLLVAAQHSVSLVIGCFSRSTAKCSIVGWSAAAFEFVTSDTAACPFRVTRGY
jgi:hypothetical protein